MNVQPKLSQEIDPGMALHGQAHDTAHSRRQPGGPRGFLTWPVEFEVEPWRP